MPFPKTLPNLKITLPERKRKITQTKDAYFSFLENWDDEKILSEKEYKALILDKNDKVVCHISLGSKIVKQKAGLEEIFAIAKRQKGVKIIFGQNNPAGNVLPSAEQASFARKFKTCGDKLNVAVVDQLILSDRSYYSFADNGL